MRLSRGLITVDDSGDLTRMTMPVLCLTDLKYDSFHRLTTWISPGGDRTSFS
jgi:hypothetical protein